MVAGLEAVAANCKLSILKVGQGKASKRIRRHSMTPAKMRRACMLLLPTVALVVAASEAAPSPPAKWKLRGGLKVLDGPGSGRYTQVRVGSDGLATIVWNGEPGLRLARCADPHCSTTTEPRTVLNSSGLPVTNPRFVRMELAENGNPVLAFATADTTQATVMHCNDPHCVTAATAVLATATKVRHCSLVLDPSVAGRAAVTFGLSDPPPPSNFDSKDCVTCAGFRDQTCLLRVQLRRRRLRLHLLLRRPGNGRLLPRGPAYQRLQGSGRRQQRQHPARLSHGHPHHLDAHHGGHCCRCLRREHDLWAANRRS